jgi:hypothetical protein
MPRGMIANTLITSCKDNICRIWAETILPDDGLINTNQEENSLSYTKISKTSRHKRTVLHKLHKMRFVSFFLLFFLSKYLFAKFYLSFDYKKIQKQLKLKR